VTRSAAGKARPKKCALSKVKEGSAEGSILGECLHARMRATWSIVGSRCREVLRNCVYHWRVLSVAGLAIWSPPGASSCGKAEGRTAHRTSAVPRTSWCFEAGGDARHREERLTRRARAPPRVHRGPLGTLSGPSGPPAQGTWCSTKESQWARAKAALRTLCCRRNSS